MDEILPSEVERAVHALALDAATAAVIAGFDARGIESVLIKGPATAHRLFSDDPDSRTYIDVDVLVDTQRFREAEKALKALGYVRSFPDARGSESDSAYETQWERDGSPPTHIDLHRGFHGVGNWSSWWSVMDANTEVITVGGYPVRIPDAAGCALVVTLHDTTELRSEKSASDLRQALAMFDDEVWADAARRAESVHALPSFMLGLSRFDGGRQLAERLGLSSALTPEVATRALSDTGADPLQVGRAWALHHRLGAVEGWQERGRTVLDMIFPSAEYLRAIQPLARRGRLGLAAVRIARPIALAARAPGVLWLLVKGRRRARQSGWDGKSDR